MATRGFTGRRPTEASARRLPPGQFETDEFPVLSKGPAPRIDLQRWQFQLSRGPKPLASWNWHEFNQLPQTTWQGDIHCVTTWSKFDTVWRGVSIDDLLAAAGIAPPTAFALALSHDDYDTNVSLADLLGGRAMVATHFGSQPLEAAHGGPARLLVPHLYFWKSAKWLKGLKFTERDEAGFWELRGYHMRGDPWRQQRYSDDA